MANDILVKVGADINDFSRKMNETSKTLTGIGKATSGATLTVGKLATAIGAVALASKAFGLVGSSISSAFGRIDTMERFGRVMTEITGSAGETKKALDRTNETVKGTAFGLDVAAQAVQNFVTRGVSVDDATKRIAAWGDAVAFYGEGSNAQLSSVMDALAKMTTKGKVEMDQLNRLFDAGIDAVGMYAQASGMSAETVQEALSKGEISADQFISTVTTAMMEGTNGVTNIAGAAKEAGASWGASFDNMRAAVARGTEDIIGSIDEMLTENGLPDMRTMVADFGKKFEDVLKTVGDKIPEIIEKIKDFYDKLEPWLPLIKDISVVVGTFIATMSILNTTVKAAQAVWLAFNAILAANPIVLVISAVVALVAAGILLWKNWDTVKEKGRQLFTAIKKVFGDMKTAVSEKMEAVREKVKEAWNKAKKFLEGIDLRQIGKDIIQGLINGIGAMGGAVWKAAKSIARNVKDSIMSFLGVHSPSRVLAQIGQFTGEGFVKGIADTRKEVVRAANGLADAAVPKVSLAYSTPSGVHSTLADAISSTVSVSASDNNQLLGEILAELKRNRQMIVEMDSHEVGRLVAEPVTREQNMRRGIGRRTMGI